ncbi:MAG: DUF58 domain-containing protein [Bacteroidia bacterium]|nr:DUF58 domain-containing protein [Bacteroidia bacterium]
MAAIKLSEYGEYSRLKLLARQVVEGFITGLHKSPFHGFSVEFAEHRIYNTGESTRHIDWKLYGRTGKLFVKKYEEETNLRCQLVLDSSSSMYYPEGGYNKMTFAVECAAVLIELLHRQRDAAGLSVFNEKLTLHTQARSTPVHLNMLYSELERLWHPFKPGSETKTFAAEALHNIAEAVHKRSLVIIFSDMMGTAADGGGDLFAALQHLRHNKHEVILFHITQKQGEDDFLFPNRPYKFIDMESGVEVKVHPSEVKDRYLAAMDAYRKELLLRCRQYRIDFVEAHIDKGFRQVLLPYLVKRSKLL